MNIVERNVMGDWTETTWNYLVGDRIYEYGVHYDSLRMKEFRLDKAGYYYSDLTTHYSGHFGSTFGAKAEWAKRWSADGHEMLAQWDLEAPDPEAKPSNVAMLGPGKRKVYRWNHIIGNHLVMLAMRDGRVIYGDVFNVAEVKQDYDAAHALCDRVRELGVNAYEKLYRPFVLKPEDTIGTILMEATL